ncbi:MAG TPA: DUF4139 domain-containing protein, partial [Gemmata sp.]
MRPSYLLPVVGLTFGLMALAPIARGDGQPGAKQPAAKSAPTAAAPKLPPPASLPITRVVLFSAGVAYFHREGDVTGDARLDLRFEESDVNDLLKSLVLTDKDGGKVRAVTYDNRMPLDVTLKGLAVDVTENPTMGQLMHQVRGEKVEIADKGGVVTIGQIVSVERQPPPAMGPDPGEILNLLTEDGLQTAELKQLKRIKFVRPELQAEFKKALEMLATARGDNKKAVSVVFSGAGKRKVAVGYVVEAPLWKPSYRLSVDEKGATRIQGWATVENTTDEDWNNVKIGLVAGRPMSFQMDLYDPLFVPRPMVEPDLFASLRPPMYQGGLNPLANPMGMAMGNNGGNPFNQLGGAFGNGANQQNLGVGGGIAGFGGGGFQGGQFGNLGGQFGIQGGQLGNFGVYPQRVPRPNLRTLYGDRLSYSEYVNRVRGNPSAPAEGEKPAPQTVRDPLDKQAGALAVADGALGDMFEYTIDEPITLAKQKSALVPLVNEAVEGSRISIYNASTLTKYPLLGLKLVNKTKLHLAQGPVAVYDNGTFAGDARLPDIKPNETRLVSYAIDLGTEVVPQPGEIKRTILSATVADGVFTVRSGQKKTTTYLVRNRNPQDRTVIIEHPLRTDWKLVSPAKPDDRTRSFYRFELPVKSGALGTLEVTEEAPGTEYRSLASASTEQLREAATMKEAKPAVREVFKKLLDLRGKVDDVQKGIAEEQAALKEITDDQERLRKNIERAPKESETFKRYLKKFDDQETEIEKRQARVRELKADLV